MNFIGIEFYNILNPNHCYTVIKNPYQTRTCLINECGFSACCGVDFLEHLVKAYPGSHFDYKITKFPGSDQINIF